MIIELKIFMRKKCEQIKLCVIYLNLNELDKKIEKLRGLKGMQYREMKDNSEKVSLLGFGCMRFKTSAGQIVKEKAFEQLKYAYDKGVNYFDTAYPYHAGKSEVILGEFIKKEGIREKVFIADKLPGYLVLKPEQIEKFFNTQLKRLGTTYIDYYLMHTLDTYESWLKLKEFGIEKFIEDRKRSGVIRNIGFSFHGQPDEFIKILEDYSWDFCQIQYNYLDVNYQAGQGGLDRAAELKIPVVVMEPLRGGSLATNIPPKALEIFKEYSDDRSPAKWALQWIMNNPNVKCVLSGMNDISQIDENISIANETLPGSVTEGELKVIEKVKAVFDQLMKVPCTGCNYCMPCPLGVDIPAIFSDYNNRYFFGYKLILKVQYASRAAGYTGNGKSGPDQCINCGKCVKLCPQNIEIPAKLGEAHAEMNRKLFRLAMAMAVKILKGKNNKK